MTRAVPLLVPLALAGCATSPPVPFHVPDANVYQATKDPIQYRSPLPRDLDATPARPREATGVACHTGIYLPTQQSSPFLGSQWLANAVSPANLGVLWGDAGVIRAMEEAKANAGGGTLFDVRLDVHSISVLGIFHRDCLEVHASVRPG